MSFVTIKVDCPESLKDYLISTLFEKGFDSFQELEEGFEGSCLEESFNKKEVDRLISQFPNLNYHVLRQEKINWNKEWEKNYDPVIVANECIVRAAFHQPTTDFTYEIIVTPKMSFGTGHHATTYQVLAYQMQLDHQGKKVLDVGTGTGVLSIMAHKRGATQLVATDIDEWCIENAAENFHLNGIVGHSLFKCDIHSLDVSGFDIIIANINKNILMEQLQVYAMKLAKNGVLILSGFYEEDVEELTIKANDYSLKKIAMTAKDRWSMLVLSKEFI